MENLANSANSGTIELVSGSFDDGDDGEHDGVGLAKISEVFKNLNRFF